MYNVLEISYILKDDVRCEYRIVKRNIESNFGKCLEQIK